ncbi:uncharacterized protein LOC125177951, partial [Hyalella azteca]|uniref:Uncharacterized protein LOC125177951 n=1 Tax=Hyalella azteca TaxID=294128 RepID=A0A979FI76_HYAAZ
MFMEESKHAEKESKTENNTTGPGISSLPRHRELESLGERARSHQRRDVGSDEDMKLLLLSFNEHHFPVLQRLEQLMLLMAFPGIGTTFLLLLGLLMNRSLLLLPWLTSFGMIVVLDVVYIPYSFYFILNRSLLLLPWLTSFGMVVVLDVVYIPYSFYFIL